MLLLILIMKLLKATKIIALHMMVLITSLAQKIILKYLQKTLKKYTPQYGGYCAYAIAIKSKKVSINPESFEVKDGKLYLFYNAWGTNTLELWKKENKMKGLQIKADKNWEAIKLE